MAKNNSRGVMLIDSLAFHFCEDSFSIIHCTCTISGKKCSETKRKQRRTRVFQKQDLDQFDHRDCYELLSEFNSQISIFADIFIAYCSTKCFNDVLFLQLDSPVQCCAVWAGLLFSFLLLPSTTTMDDFVFSVQPHWVRVDPTCMWSWPVVCRISCLWLWSAWQLCYWYYINISVVFATPGAVDRLWFFCVCEQIYVTLKCGVIINSWRHEITVIWSGIECSRSSSNFV